MIKTCICCGISFAKSRKERAKAFELRKYCSRSCSAIYTNSASPKRAKIAKHCCDCGTVIESVRRVKRCEPCKHLSYSKAIGSRTKGELFKSRSNWQSARSSIVHHARKTFFLHNTDPCCKACGYSLHIEVAHIKAVSSFTDETLIKEINAPSNLVGLCPTHHWEFDNNFLSF